PSRPRRARARGALLLGAAFVTEHVEARDSAHFAEPLRAGPLLRAEGPPLPAPGGGALLAALAAEVAGLESELRADGDAESSIGGRQLHPTLSFWRLIFCFEQGGFCPVSGPGTHVSIRIDNDA
ncbi:unnamed protein product, partial [Prorocentrum cordatum]